MELSLILFNTFAAAILWVQFLPSAFIWSLLAAFGSRLQRMGASYQLI